MKEALTMANLEANFEGAKRHEAVYVGVVINMDGFPKPEVIINSAENFDSKLDYYKKTYDENLKHKHAPGISIIGFTYGNSFAAVESDLFD